MHTNNLGIYMILNAEGLIILAQYLEGTWRCTFAEALRHLYRDFKVWCVDNGVKCSQRLFRPFHLHMNGFKGVETYPWLISKALNARVILAFVADPQTYQVHVKFLLGVSFGLRLF